MADRGRPTKFKKEFVKQAEKLAALGATDREAAEFFEIDEATLYRWKHTHPEFCDALKVGKATADDRVEQSLYRRALGYSHDAVKIISVEKGVRHEPYIEHYPPDTTAAIFWLKNRRPDTWRDKREIDNNLGIQDSLAALLEEVDGRSKGLPK